MIHGKFSLKLKELIWKAITISRITNTSEVFYISQRVAAEGKKLIHEYNNWAIYRFDIMKIEVS